MTSGGDDQLYSVSKSPRWGGAIGVNKHRSGFKSSRGVPSRQSRPRTSRIGPRRPTRMTSDVPIGFRPCRRADGECPSRVAVIARALANEIAAGFVQPIKNLDLFELIDAFQSRDPGLVHLNATDRPIATSLPRTIQARRPRCPDGPDEHKARIDRRRQLNRDLVPSDFVQSDHDVEVALLML